MHRLQEFDQASLKQKVPQFKAGDTVKVHCKIKEGSKERIQIFEGVVISRHNSGVSSSFTVRKVSHGVGVERVFPLHGPSIDKIDVTTVGKVRQSRIYYLRELSGKKARIQAVDTRGQTQAEVAPEVVEPEPKEEAKTEAAPEPETVAPAAPAAEAPQAEDKPPEDKPADEKKK